MPDSLFAVMYGNPLLYTIKPLGLVKLECAVLSWCVSFLIYCPCAQHSSLMCKPWATIHDRFVCIGQASEKSKSTEIETVVNSTGTKQLGQILSSKICWFLDLQWSHLFASTPCWEWWGRIFGNSTGIIILSIWFSSGVEVDEGCGAYRSIGSIA